MFKNLNKINNCEQEFTPPSVFFPVSFKDIDKIIDTLDIGKNIIVNVKNMKKEDKYRVIDFLSGYIYAKKGKRKKLEASIFSFEP